MVQVEIKVIKSLESKARNAVLHRDRKKGAREGSEEEDKKIVQMSISERRQYLQRPGERNLQ